MNYAGKGIGRLTAVLLSVTLTWITPKAQVLSISEIESSFTSMKLNETIQIGEYTFKVASEHTSSTSGVHYKYLQQTWDEVPIFGAIMALGSKASGEIELFGNRMVTTRQWDPAPLVWPRQSDVVRSALEQLDLNKGRSQAVEAAPRYKNIWYPDGEAWVPSVEIRYSDDKGPWKVVVDLKGQMLDKRSLVIRCNHDHRPETTLGRFNDACQVTVNPTAASQSYLVYPLGSSGPHVAGQQLITQPADPLASPFGWHDTSATISPDFNDTRGNNTFVQEDRNATNGPGYRPSGGTELQFDFIHDRQTLDSAQLDPALTNLFYWINVNHDVLYHHGFDEAAGNFQWNNYTRGGRGRDPVVVDGLDGAFRNNAIFIPAPDGEQGRIETSLWSTSLFDAEVVIGSQAAPLVLPALESQFSSQNQLQNVGDIRGEAIFLNDAQDSRLACQMAEVLDPEYIKGRIAIVDRGTCFFTQKAQTAQALGAIGLIVVQNESATPFPMGGSDGSITIPAVMVSLSSRDQLLELAQKGSGISFSIRERQPAPARAASFDNSVITHEYAHGLTTRLTGGKQTIDCLLNQEEMSEGTCDYVGLMLTTDWNSINASNAFGFATYLTGDMSNGSGIRTHAYSRDLLINPLTYEDLPFLQVPHGVGTLWASILWDMTWNMIEIDGITTDLYQGLAGNTNALKIVVEALKIQPCYPGYVDARDALLQAATVLNLDRYHYPIWRAFARRGVGINADQRSPNNRSDGVADFTLPLEFQSLLDDFQLMAVNNSASLNWSMLQEFGSSKFLIERSKDEGPFVILDEPIAAGISENPTAYSRMNLERLEEFALYRYRLGLEDVDGTITYLVEDSIRLVPTEDIAVFPNPASDQLNIFVGSDFPMIEKLSLFDTHGLLVDRQTVSLEGGQTMVFPIPSIPAGIYFLEANAAARSVVRKIVIE